MTVSKKSAHWLLCLRLRTALLEQVFGMVSPDPLRSTGFNGSGSPAWCLGSTIFHPPDVKPTSLVQADHSVLRLLQISQQHIESQLDRIRHERELWKEVWNCGMLENSGDETTKVALKISLLVMDSEQLWFQSLSFQGVCIQGI